jgi:hypothetical protein
MARRVRRELDQLKARAAEIEGKIAEIESQL